MKIRIKDNSIRFRLTLREVEELKETARLEKTTAILNTGGPEGTFRYSVEHHGNLRESRVSLDNSSIRFALCPEDFKTLCDPEKEGAYIRREWTDDDGNRHRFMAFVEKDRPGSTCVKPEEWIYDDSPGKPVETRPIPKT